MLGARRPRLRRPRRSSNLRLRLGRSQLAFSRHQLSLKTSDLLAHFLTAKVACMQGTNLDCLSALTSRPSLKLSSNLHLRLCRSRLSLSVDSVSTPLLPFLHAL